MNTIQLELTPAPAVKIDVVELELLTRVLDDGIWMTATEIARQVADHHDQAWTDRRIRALAAASEGQIISGQAGYKLTARATIVEVQHASGWLRHQGTEMHRRALEIDRVYHRKQTAVK